MNMKQDLLRCLPSEIIMETLSRLPLQSILSCKCVSKWLHDLVETHDFALFHLSKSVSGLAITVVPNRNVVKAIKLTNVLHLSTITSFSFIHRHTWIEGSADGLLLLKTLECDFKSNGLYICNPITREYINILSNIRPFAPPERVINYGFGVSKISGQYKAVRICMVRTTFESDCKVYTVGSGCWRSIARRTNYLYTNRKAVFVNGNLHWVVLDINDGTLLISCFDLETELFTTFSVPNEMRSIRGAVLAAAEDSLYLCDCNPNYLVTIWKMKEYGIDKSWTKEFVFSDNELRFIYPVTASKEGVMLKPIPGKCFLYYSSKYKTTQTLSNYPLWRSYMSLHSHIPSFVSLKSFKMENVFSF